MKKWKGQIYVGRKVSVNGRKIKANEKVGMMDVAPTPTLQSERGAYI